jgi:pilus assembly protein CpaE
MGPICLIGCPPELVEPLAAELSASSEVGVVIGNDVAAIPAAASAVLFGPELAAEDALAMAAALRSERPALAVILVSRHMTVPLLKSALRTGVRDVLSPQDTPAEVTRALLAAAADAPAASLPASADTPADGCRVVSVLGTKGGVGKSVVATNLAAALARAGHRTVLVDLDLQFGDVAIMLQLPPDRTIRDVVRVFDRLDADLLDGFLVEHSSGLRVLLAPVAPEEAEWVEPAHVARILEMMRATADFIVIDTPPALDDVVLTALEASDVVYAVATPDVPSIKNLRVALNKLRQLGVPSAEVRVVLNRADSKVGLDESDVRKATACEIAIKVPSDRLVPRAVNRGVPIVVDQPRSPVARSFRQLATAVAAAVEVASDVA